MGLQVRRFQGLAYLLELFLFTGTLATATMPCSIKVLGGCSVPTLIFGFIVTILGLVIMTSSVPKDTCGGGLVTITQENQDSIDTALVYIAWPLLLGGLLACIGGGCGVWGGFKNTKCGVCSAAVLLGIAAGFLVIGALAALFFASVFGTLCLDCDTQCSSMYGSTTQCGGDVCCREDGLFCRQTCKSTSDWACELQSKKLAGTAFGFIGAVFAIICCALGCGTTCCPDSYTDLGTEFGPKTGSGAAPQQAAVIGQPVIQVAGQMGNEISKQ